MEERTPRALCEVPRADAQGSERGSSLVELTVAIAAAVTIACAVMTATVRHSTHRQANEERNLASLAALDTLERMRSVPFGTLASMDGTGFDVLGRTGAPKGLHPLDGDADGLPGRLIVQPERSFGGETIWSVTAVVEWAGLRPSNRIDFRQLMVERK